MILHAIVSDFDSALQAVDAGATVVQLRLKDATTDERVAVGGAFGALDATFVVNDDVDAARGAEGPGTFHARLYDALYALTPEALDGRANIGDA